MNIKELSNKIREELRQEIESSGAEPKLAVIQVGDGFESNVYIRNKQKACEGVGILTNNIKLPKDISESELVSIVHHLNNDKETHGILVQLPLPKHINERRVSQAISPIKDVDGFHSYNLGGLVVETEAISPCTPLGITNILKHWNVNLVGKNVVVVGRSNIVGKPLAIMLINSGATVTVCNSKTKNLKEFTRNADVVITAIGKPKYFTKDYFKDGAYIIDVGINRSSDGKLCGDVDYEDVVNIAKEITPVPGGVGLMTVTQLLANTLECYNYQQ